MKTAEGQIEFAVPQLAETVEPFPLRIREVIRGRTEERERLVHEDTVTCD